MTLWIDINGYLHDDMNGDALTLPSWPKGMTQATAAQVQAIQNPSLTQAQVQAVLDTDVQAYIDSKATAKGYDSAASCLSYLNSSNATWKADAVAMNSWRDAVWGYCFMNATSATPSTTWAQLQPLLPAAPW